MNEMRKRVLSSNIQKEKLDLKENSKRMTDFFQREIERYNKRKQNMCKKQHESDELKRENDELKLNLKTQQDECEELKKIVRKQMDMLERAAQLQRAKRQSNHHRSPRWLVS